MRAMHLLMMCRDGSYGSPTGPFDAGSRFVRLRSTFLYCSVLAAFPLAELEWG